MEQTPSPQAGSQSFAQLAALSAVLLGSGATEQVPSPQVGLQSLAHVEFSGEPIIGFMEQTPSPHVGAQSLGQLVMVSAPGGLCLQKPSPHTFCPGRVC